MKRFWSVFPAVHILIAFFVFLLIVPAFGGPKGKGKGPTGKVAPGLVKVLDLRSVQFGQWRGNSSTTLAGRSTPHVLKPS